MDGCLLSDHAKGVQGSGEISGAPHREGGTADRAEGGVCPPTVVLLCCFVVAVAVNIGSSAHDAFRARNKIGHNTTLCGNSTHTRNGEKQRY